MMRQRPAGPVTVCLLALAATLPAQANDQESFPPTGWQTVEPPARKQPGPSRRPTAHLLPDKTLKLQIPRPKDWPEAVVTDAAGVVLARGSGNGFAVAGREVGDRYVLYLSRPQQRQYRRLQSDFVRFPGSVFPTRQWQARQQAKLELKQPRQYAPRTRSEARANPHRITFLPDQHELPAVYLLARVVAGGQDMVAAQSLSGALPLWFRARRGESFRIYELHPLDRTYRASRVLTVEKSFPRGR